MKKLQPQYFNELKSNGSTVPRYKESGEVIPFKVGKTYTVGNIDNAETIKVICTQNSPFCIKTITENK